MEPMLYARFSNIEESVASRPVRAVLSDWMTKYINIFNRFC